MKKLTLIIFATVALASCRKVINVDLNSVASKYVIEGGVSNGLQPCQIKITKTKNFSDDNNFQGISNAFVTVSDNAGNFDTLSYLSQGIYQTNTMPGVPGRTYFLTVKIDNETFTSVSQMPMQINMDSLYTYNFLILGDTIKIANLKFNDPSSVENYYRFVLTLNNSIKKNIFISDDKLTNGKLVIRGISYRDGDEEFKANDSVRIEMQCIDKDVHNYFFTLNQTIGQSSAAPTNPISNISGGALGYFSAYTSQQKAIKIQ
jgi:hypothetical protein